MTQNLTSLDDPWCISRELFAQITQILPPNSTILELGSGRGTGVLTSKYQVHSIEHDAKWVGYVKNSHYIHAPLTPCQIAEFPHHKQWYDPERIKSNLPPHYDLILIDGPTGNIGRGGFYQYRHLFNLNVPIILDDVNRRDEQQLATLLAQVTQRPLRITKGSLGLI